MTGCMAVGCLLGSFLGKSYPVLLIAFVLIGVGLSGGLYLIPMINGDVIDKDEIDNGARREGVYAGVNSLITKPASAIAHAVFTAMMAGYGYDENITIEGSTAVDWVNQPQSAKDGVFMSWMLIVGILCVLSFVAMIFFPLHGKKWDEQKAQLAKEHEEKEAAYAASVLAPSDEVVVNPDGTEEDATDELVKEIEEEMEKEEQEQK